MARNETDARNQQTFYDAAEQGYQKAIDRVDGLGEEKRARERNVRVREEQVKAVEDHTLISVIAGTGMGVIVGYTIAVLSDWQPLLEAAVIGGSTLAGGGLGIYWGRNDFRERRFRPVKNLTSAQNHLENMVFEEAAARADLPLAEDFLVTQEALRLKESKRRAQNARLRAEAREIVRTRHGQNR